MSDNHRQPVLCRRRLTRGMTLIELLMSLGIVAIVLGAIATLAYAMNSAKAAGDDMTSELARVRVVAVKLPELIRNSKLVCYSSTAELALWYADHDGNNQININELVYVTTGTEGAHLALRYLSSDANPTVALSDIGSYSSQWWQSYGASINEIYLMRNCSDGRIAVDAAAPYTAWVTVTAAPAAVEYSFSASLLARSANLLTGSGEIAADDD